jgi:hypothetical protein
VGMARQCAFAAVLLLCFALPSLHSAAVKLVPVMEEGAVSVGCTSNVRDFYTRASAEIPIRQLTHAATAIRPLPTYVSHRSRARSRSVSTRRFASQGWRR